MPNEKDFIIENGVLIEYKGNDKEVVVPDEVKSIRNNAFEGKNIEKLTLGKNVEHIVMETQKGFWGHYTQNFGDLILSNLKEFKVSPENDSYLSADGVLYDKKSSRLLAVPSQKEGTLKILNGTINVNFHALNQWNGDIVVCPSSLNNYLYNEGLFAFNGKIRDIVLSRDADIQKIWNSEQMDLKRYSHLSPTSDNLNIVFPDEESYKLSLKSIANSKIKHSDLYEYYLEKSSCLEKRLENKGLHEQEIERRMEILYDNIMENDAIEYNISLLNDAEIDKYYDNAFASEYYDFKDGILTFKNAESFNACLYYQEEFPHNHLLSVPYPEEVKKIVLPEDIQYIPNGCLKDYKSLEELIAPSVTRLGDYALCGCTNLKKVEFSPEIKRENIETRALYYCTSLTDAVPEIMAERNICKEQELPEPDENGFIIKDGVLLKYVGNDKNVIIPEGVTNIEDYAFANNIHLESVIFPKELISIGEHAFYNCLHLQKIDIPNGVLNIDYCAFYGCDNLKDISLPDGIENIGACAFDDTAYYDNQLNWQDGVLYINNYSIDTKTEQEYEYDDEEYDEEEYEEYEEDEEYEYGDEYEYDEEDYEEELTNNATAIGKLIESQTKDELVAGDEVLNKQEQLSVPVTSSGEDISHDDDNHDEF